MSTLTLRTIKGTSLTNAELDANFTNILVAIGGTNGAPYTLPVPTGTGSPVLSNSPTLVTPSLGVASATSLNKVTITSVATGSTLSIADTKTVTINNTLTLSGTDSSTITFGAGGTVAYTSNKLSAFAATSSAELLGIISDETGTGLLVFNNAPTFVGTVTIPTLNATTINSTNSIQLNGTTIVDNSRVLSNVKTKSNQEIVTAITASTSTTTIDLSTGSVFVITISANTTFAFTNIPSGTDMTSFTIITVNDATAGRAVSWPASVTWAGGNLPPRTTTANKSDAWSFFTRNAGTVIVGSLAVANY